MSTGYDLDAHMWWKLIVISTGGKGVWDLEAYFQCWGLCMKANATSIYLIFFFISFPLFSGFVAAIAPEVRILEINSATPGHPTPQT